jgi:hypothetical protein
VYKEETRSGISDNFQKTRSGISDNFQTLLWICTGIQNRNAETSENIGAVWLNILTYKKRWEHPEDRMAELYTSEQRV